MRRNRFGEAYCHTADEARHIIDERDIQWEVYVGEISPPEGVVGATAEILDVHQGETICYIEAPSVDAVKAILLELKIQ